MATKRTAYAAIPRNLIATLIVVGALIWVLALVYRAYTDPDFNKTPAELKGATKSDEQRKQEDLGSATAAPNEVQKIFSSKEPQFAVTASSETDKSEDSRSESAKPGSISPTGSGLLPPGAPSSNAEGKYLITLDEYERRKNANAPANSQSTGGRKMALYELGDGPERGMSAIVGSPTAGMAPNSSFSSGSPDAIAARIKAETDGVGKNRDDINRLIAQSQASQSQGDGNSQRVAGTPAKMNEDFTQNAQAGGRLSPMRARRTDFSAQETLHEGCPIRAVLRQPITSDLPGTLSAHLLEDVYDCVTGAGPLLLKGSVLKGVYNAEVVMGQQRINAAFTNLTTRPYGAKVNLGSMAVGDQQGISGLPADVVDTHFLRIFGSSFLIAGFASLGKANANSGVTINVAGGTASSLQAAAGQVLSQTSQKILERNLNIAPTLKILNPGRIFTIIVNRDLQLPAEVIYGSND